MQDNFELDVKIDEPLNMFNVIHVYNKTDVYHITRQILLNSILRQETDCFFYHILSMNTNDFNQLYGSVGCIIIRSNFEADLYLNANPDALEHVIKYIQTCKLDMKSIYGQNWKTIGEILDLATIFGMPKLVSVLRNVISGMDNSNLLILPTGVANNLYEEIAKNAMQCQSIMNININNIDEIVTNTIIKFRQELSRQNID